MTKLDEPIRLNEMSVSRFCRQMQRLLQKPLLMTN